MFFLERRIAKSVVSKTNKSADRDEIILFFFGMHGSINHDFLEKKKKNILVVGNGKQWN